VSVNLSFDTYSDGARILRAGLITNLLLAVSCPPLLLIALLGSGPPSITGSVLLLPTAAPGMAAAFGVFAGLTQEPDRAPGRAFVRAWRRSWRPALAVAAVGSAALGILAADVGYVWGTPYGALLIPLFLTLAALAGATTLLALVAVSQGPSPGPLALLRPCAVLAARRWYLSAMSLAVLSVLPAAVAARPALGLGLAPAPLLYVVWANGRHSLRPAALARPPATASPRADRSLEGTGKALS